ncbi:MAG TPA: hypothetical protein PLD59_17045, partial [Tepidisphaeraceae bacterium]|nr:hypothetical protein [Tepidisphaeraceae bacterium]
YFGSDWRYFPLHVFCKATIGELALASVGVLSLLWRGPSRLEWCWASAGAILVGGMLLLTDINIGGPRYLLYAYPIAFVLLGRTSGGCASVAGMRVARSFFALAAITSAVESVVSAPRYHSFYNIAARGLQFDVPESDWGQDLVALREWLAEQPIGVRDRIAVMTSAPTWAEAYDLRALELRNVARTRYVAVGRQFLTGLPRRHRGEYCMLRNWRALQLQPAIADLGGMLIFESHQLQPLQGPAVLIVESWEQALADPLLPTMRNLDQRKQQGR